MPPWSLAATLTAAAPRGAPTKNRLGALIELVRRGQSVLILDRGRPVARLEPVGAGAGDEGEDEGWPAELERKGILKRPTAPPPEQLVASPPPNAASRASVLATLLDERRSGR